jgi:hypothetical protein
MPLDGSRPVVLGEDDGGPQQSRSNATTPMALVDGEAGHPPTPGSSSPRSFAGALLPLTPGMAERGPTLVQPAGRSST